MTSNTRHLRADRIIRCFQEWDTNHKTKHAYTILAAFGPEVLRNFILNKRKEDSLPLDQIWEICFGPESFYEFGYLTPRELAYVIITMHEYQCFKEPGMKELLLEHKSIVNSNTPKRIRSPPKRFKESRIETPLVQEPSNPNISEAL